MANETQIGELIIRLQVKTETLEQSLNVAKKRLQEVENQNKNLVNSNKSLDSSWIALSATAAASFAGIVSAIKSATEEYKAHEQAMSSLENVADYTGNSLNDFNKIMNKYSSVMNKTDLATTIKNFSLMGMSVEETDKMIQALTNSAIRNRNANYTVSEAVRVASEGYRQGLSTLSDSAGVTENLSVMLDNYAQSIGKTASQLTEAEKNQAYLNRTMYAAEPFAGAMEGYLDTLAGKQGEYSQTLRDTNVAYTEAMEPILVKFEEFKTNMVSGLGNIISQHGEAAAGVTAFITTLLALSVTLLAVKKAHDIYAKSAIASTIATKGLTAAIMANPIGLAVGAITLGISAIAGFTAATETQKAKQEEYNATLERHNEIMQEKIDLEDVDPDSMDNMIDKMQHYISLLKEQNLQTDSFNGGPQPGPTPSGPSSNETYPTLEEVETMANGYAGLTEEINNTSDKIKELTGVQKQGNFTAEEVNEMIDKYTKINKKATAQQKAKEVVDVEKVKTQQKEAAQLKINANQMQGYLDVVKKGDKSTSEYQNAVTALAKAYPEAANAEGIIIDKAQDYINIEQAKADQAWNTSQQTIQGNIEIINTLIEQANAAKFSEERQAELAKTLGISYENIIPTLSSVLGILQMIGGYSPTEVPNVQPTTVSAPKKSSGGASSYSNKKLDNYKKEIEHKKAMDQISLQQEIDMYEYALKHYAKTADERMELREKIYSLNKELAQKEKEMLDQQTEDYEAYIQQQINNRGAEYDITEKNRDYNKIISMHRNYLNQIMKDERLSLDERKEIYREELDTIREYEQQKRDLRVQEIDNTVSQLTDAITKELEEMQEKDKEMIDKNLEEIEKWKDERIKAIEEEYDARIEAINKELEALEKVEEEKTRAEEDEEYEKKKKRLEDLIAYEHDATTKANYQKELDKLVADYQKTLDKRALDDQKEALNQQKELLEQEQDEKVKNIEDEAEKQTEIYEKQLEELEKYYDEQLEKAQETAEKMLLNVSQNQDKILELLKKYGNAYEITGQSLGEKLAQGINEGLAANIENLVQKIQDSIDRGIEAKISEWNRELYRYESGANKPQANTINITQQNYIQQMPELPSETYRKLQDISEKLASSIDIS